MNRREFLENVCKAGAGIVIGGVALDAANIKTIKAYSRQISPEVREIPLNLEDTPDLKPVGGTYHLELEDLDRDILVIHVSEHQYMALDIKCTHKGCDLNYVPEKKNLYCPCHASEFDLSGKVLKGPAKKDLNWYRAELKGDEVIVTVYSPGEKIPANCIPSDSIAIPKVDTTESPADLPKPDPFK